MKRLAVFCDGTWNKMSAEHPTNVLVASKMVETRTPDGVQQLIYYDEGVGTSFVINEWLETRLAGAFGWGLLEKIEAAYRFLIFNYEPGDEILSLASRVGHTPPDHWRASSANAALSPGPKRKISVKSSSFIRTAQPIPTAMKLSRFE